MNESSKADDSIDTSKNIIETSSSLNTTVKSLSNDTKSPAIKPKIPQSKFEAHLVDAYKKLLSTTENKPAPKKGDKKVDKKALKIQMEEEERNNVNACETDLRKALEEIRKIQNISLNKNIIDKTSRIYKRNKINLSLVIGQIYIQLMRKKIYSQNIIKKTA